jgi:hypothetical protein
VGVAATLTLVRLNKVSGDAPYAAGLQLTAGS